MTEPTVWFAHAGGGQQGPLSREELASMAAEGRLLPDDLVWESGTPEWIPAARVLTFAPPSPPAPSSVTNPPALPPAPLRRPAVSKREPLLSRVSRDFDSFELGELLPVARVADPEVLGVPSTWLLLAFGLAPLFLAAVVEDPTLRIRLFRLGTGAAWAVFLLTAFRTPRPSTRLLVSLFCAGGLLAALVVTVLPPVPPLSWLLSLTEPARAWPLRLFGWLLAAGLVQEGLKLLVLVLVARVVGGLSNAADGVFFGVAGGLGFGLWEAAVTSEWTSPRQGGLLALVESPSTGLEALFVSSLARSLATPALQAAWGGVAGYFAGLAAERRAPTVLAAGLALAALLHASYEASRAADRGLTALFFAAVSFLAFLAFRRAGEAGRVSARA